MAKEAAVAKEKNPAEGARYRKVVGITSQRGSEKSVRIACYNPRLTAGECMVTLGLGPVDPDTMSQVSVQITPENWAEICDAMTEALQAAL